MILDKLKYVIYKVMQITEILFSLLVRENIRKIDDYADFLWCPWYKSQ